MPTMAPRSVPANTLPEIVATPAPATTDTATPIARLAHHIAGDRDVAQILAPAGAMPAIGAPSTTLPLTTVSASTLMPMPGFGPVGCAAQIAHDVAAHRGQPAALVEIGDGDPGCRRRRSRCRRSPRPRNRIRNRSPPRRARCNYCRRSGCRRRQLPRIAEKAALRMWLPRTITSAGAKHVDGVAVLRRCRRRAPPCPRCGCRRSALPS